MKNRSAIALFCLAVASPFAHADITGNVSLTSDYRYKGISQTGDNPALQGDLEYAHDSGFYAGVWGSNVDFYKAGDPWDNNESIEIDLYGGYAGSLNDTLGYDVTLYHYFYPGAIDNVDYNEIKFNVNVGAASFGYDYAPDYINAGKNYQYIEANYNVGLPADFSLDLHAGYSFGSFFDNPDVAGLDKYTDYSLTLSRSLAGMDLSLAYLDTTIDSPYAIDSDYLANQSTWLFTVSKSF